MFFCWLILFKCVCVCGKHTHICVMYVQVVLINCYSQMQNVHLFRMDDFRLAFLRLCKDHHIDAQDCVVEKLKRYVYEGRGVTFLVLSLFV